MMLWAAGREWNWSPSLNPWFIAAPVISAFGVFWVPSSRLASQEVYHHRQWSSTPTATRRTKLGCIDGPIHFLEDPRGKSLPLGCRVGGLCGEPNYTVHRRVDFFSLALLDFGGLAKTRIGPVDITGRGPKSTMPRNESWMPLCGSVQAVDEIAEAGGHSGGIGRRRILL